MVRETQKRTSYGFCANREICSTFFKVTSNFSPRYICTILKKPAKIGRRDNRGDIVWQCGSLEVGGGLLPEATFWARCDRYRLMQRPS